MERLSGRRCVLAALALAFLAVQLPAVADDEVAKLRAQRDELEIQIELLRRDIPLPADLSDIRARLTNLAGKAELDLTIREPSRPVRVNYQGGLPSPIETVSVVIEGKDHFGDLTFFLSMLRYSGWVVQVESMRITAEGDGTARFSARLVLPQYAGFVASPVKGSGSDPVAAMREQLESLRRLRDLLLELTNRNRPEAVSEALALFTRSAESSLITLREVRLDSELILDGFVIGAAARRALSNALTTARLVATKSTMPEAGLCRSFVISAVLAPASKEIDETSDAFVAGNGLFDAQVPALCAPRVGDAPKSIVVRGKDSSGITLKLHDSDIAGAFRALSDASGESFIIDADVTGRVQLIIEKATLAETLGALGKAGVSVGPPPLRRVARGNAVVGAQKGEFTGESVSISLQHADLRDVFCIFTNLSGLRIRMPAGSPREVSIFASELPWDRSFEAIVASQQLHYEVEDGVVMVRSADRGSDTPALIDACAGASETSPSRLSTLTLERLETSDLVLHGLARAKEGWQAWVEMPNGRLQSIGPGQTLADGKVDAIDETGATIAGSTGTKRRVPFVAPHQ